MEYHNLPFVAKQRLSAEQPCCFAFYGQFERGALLHKILTKEFFL